MQKPPNNPVLAYIFAFLALFPSAIDILIQWYKVQGKSWKYLLMRVPPLVIILLVDIGLVVFIEIRRSRQKIDWLPALWALLELSIPLNLSAGLGGGLPEDVQQPGQGPSRSNMGSLAIIFCHNNRAHHRRPSLLFHWSFVAHLFLSTLPIWLLRRSPLLRLGSSARRPWGLLGYSCAALAAAAISLALLALPDVYQKQAGQSIVTFSSAIILIALQAYTLVYKSKGIPTHESIPRGQVASVDTSNVTLFASSESGDLEDVLDTNDPHVPETEAGH
ncbi:hypothetical protein EG329_008164 [Mollisiaceae sp. DMI_Dod_QoI]|nr:hypothetical protein EG329_008164 [Helotiales sp. DMI_Dod_QoI]